MSGNRKGFARKGNRFAAWKNPEIRNSALETGPPKRAERAFFLAGSPISALYFGAQTPGTAGTFPHPSTVSKDRDCVADDAGDANRSPPATIPCRENNRESPGFGP